MAKKSNPGKINRKKTNPVGQMKKFFREVSSEVKKVSWPSYKELTNYTVVVVIVILIFAIVVGVVDLGLSKLLELIS